MAVIVFEHASWQAVLLCLLFAVIYVGSLYVWAGSTEKNRDHPDVIRKRFVSITVVSVVVPVLVWLAGRSSESKQAHTLWEWLGLRFLGFLPAFIIPLILTMVLFMGPLALHYMDGIFRLYLEPRYWVNCIKNMIWVRNHIVAPFSEEFIFRACMLPLLVPAIGESAAMILCPLFFGVAHFHHLIERIIHEQCEIKQAVQKSMFQFFYTTVFGIYSAFLFLRTGHLIAPVIAHAFCNHMGFPAFNEVMGYPQTIRRRLAMFFVLGLVLWIMVLFPLTYPALYANDVYVL
ncbi:CAAX prenyl protease 2-like [Gigantopelta aegis]|uniref:CAAX prenyl protease 2-like n=1 Tax=Gigantopelta aegis TaxID=1735272 RepID=UPI001B88AB62|nr:CAAX prenyl protease 2-like [Gigantopelta aegis]